MTNIVNNSVNGFIQDIKIFGYTHRNCGDVYKSVGTLLVDVHNKPILNKFGEKQYKIRLLSRSLDEINEHNVDIYIPCQLESYGDVKDILYWDDKREEYCVNKKIGFDEKIGTYIYVDENIIRTRITDKSFLLLRTYDGGTTIDFNETVKGSIECITPTTLEESNDSMIEQVEEIKRDIVHLNNIVPEFNLHLYKLKVSTFIFDELIEFDKWANENEKNRIKKMGQIEVTANSKITEMNNAKISFQNDLNNKMTEINVNLDQHNTSVTEKIVDIQRQFDVKMDALEVIESNMSNNETTRNNNETTRQAQESNRQSSMNTMINTVNGKITTIDSKMTGVDNKLASVDSRVNAAIASGTVDLEIKDARVSQSGTTYTCLKDRLNAIENSPYVFYENVEG